MSSQEEKEEEPALPVLPPFDVNRHVRYFSHCLRRLPAAYASLDTNRLTLVHFAVQSLDLLGVLDDDDDDEEGNSSVVDRRAVIEWIYSLYIPPGTRRDDGEEGGDDDDGASSSSAAAAGFKGGTFLGGHLAGNVCGDCGGGDGSEPQRRRLSSEYDCGHVAMTYTALCTLAALGDDLTRFDRDGVVRALRRLQNDDGSFQCTATGSERDMRFLYCACAISSMLGDWSGINVDGAVEYVLRCRTYDGAIGLMPGQEGHGGSTFCGVASLRLMGRLNHAFASDPTWRPALVRWCVSRQVGERDGGGRSGSGSGGMQGRPNKAEDTCYSYWVGGTLRLLGDGGSDDRLLDRRRLTGYVLRNQTPMGGFSKVVGANPDVMHSFYSVAWLSLASASEDDDGTEEGGQSRSPDLGLRRMDCALGMRADRTAVFERAFPPR